MMATLSDLGPAQARLLESLLREESGERAGCYRPRAVPIRANGQTLLFFIHGSGGRVLFLEGIARHLPDDVALYGVEAEICDGVPEPAEPGSMIDRYLVAIRAVQPRGPYCFGGYSSGGLIAHQLAHRLEASGERVAGIFLVDPAAPPDHEGMVEATGPVTRLARRFEIARLAAITPLNREFPFIERVDAALTQIARGFVPQPIEARVHIVRAMRGADALSSAGLVRWQTLAGEIETEAVDADHFAIVKEPVLREVARRMAHWLTETSENL